MEKRILSVIISVISLCILLGLIGYFTGLDVGELIISGFGSLKRAFFGIRAQPPKYGTKYKLQQISRTVPTEGVAPMWEGFDQGNWWMAVLRRVRASCNIDLGQARMNLWKFSPPVPNMRPSSSHSLALLQTRSSTWSGLSPSPEKSTQARQVPCMSMTVSLGIFSWIQFFKKL